LRFVTTRHGGPVSFNDALFEGLAPDGGLYVPETIEPWTGDELSRLPRRTLTEIGLRALRPFTRGDIDPATLEAVVVEALNFEIPLVEVEPRVFALELFHGPTFAFKDVGARVMARLMASQHRGGEPLTVLVATSGDTGSAVAHAFHRVPSTRVVILYPDGRISPTQEAQLTMFNGERTNVRAYAVAGTFDDCHRLTREVFGDTDLRRRMRLTSANSVNVGRLLPQSIYYFHAIAQLAGLDGRVGQEGRDASVVFSTPSGNFGNLTAGLIAKRAGLPIAQFVAATNANDVVPAYLETGRFEPRASVQTLANAMDVGHPSNFERMSWLYGGDLEAMRHDVAGSRHDDDDVRGTIRRVYEERGYLLDPHSAIAYRGLKEQVGQVGQVGQTGQVGREGQEGDVGPRFSGADGTRAGRFSGAGQVGIFLATAHPAKFAEVVEPIIGRAVEKPAPLAQALARPRHIIRIEPSLAAVKGTLDE
jgi:threonine synthase